jgi:hypothetical protein
MFDAQARAANRQAREFRAPIFGDPHVKDNWFMSEGQTATAEDRAHPSYRGEDTWAEEIRKGKMTRTGQISGTWGVLETSRGGAPWQNLAEEALKTGNFREAIEPVVEEMQKNAGTMRLGAEFDKSSNWARVIEDTLSRDQMGVAQQQFNTNLMANIMGFPTTQRQPSPYGPEAIAAANEKEIVKTGLDIYKTRGPEALQEFLDDLATWNSLGKASTDPDVKKHLKG